MNDEIKKPVYKPVLISLDEDTIFAMTQLAFSLKTTRSELVRRAIKTFGESVATERVVPRAKPARALKR